MATSWSERIKPTTNWEGRKKPEIYMAPLQDAYRIVHDQNNKIIYILTSSGKLIPATFWKTRNPI